MTDVVGMDDIEAFNTSLDDIGGDECTLIFVGIDSSGSMDSFTSDMEKELLSFKDAMLGTKEAQFNQILLSRANFNDYIDIKGFKPVSEFDTDYYAKGNTALYDVIIEGAETLLNYRKILTDNGVRVKSIFSIFTDGEDTCSNTTIHKTIDVIEDLNKKEIASAIICFGSSAEGIGKRLKFKAILNTNSSASELRRAFQTLSKSAISASRAAGNTAETFTF